jgi:pentatricopeptide repeat protein
LFEYICDPKSPYQPDLFTVNIMLRHYARKQDLQAMMNLMDRLPSFRLAPDLVTYTTLISGLLDAGKPSAAKGILDVMQRANIEPNSYVYSLLIADLAKRAARESSPRYSRRLDSSLDHLADHGLGRCHGVF